MIKVRVFEASTTARWNSWINRTVSGPPRLRFPISATMARSRSMSCGVAFSAASSAAIDSMAMRASKISRVVTLANMNCMRKRRRELGRVARRNRRPALRTGLDLNHAQRLKPAKRLAHRNPAGLEHVGQLRLGAEELARAHPLAEKRLKNFGDNSVGQRIAAPRTKDRFACNGHYKMTIPDSYGPAAPHCSL